ncbi:divisome protein SepX/GlpR [Tsukamurella soli]|uniref:Uncharacterized protein n=1 Tax=Tsukamurella soli TaxID=644556 RepID=A0ABP8JU53_9ACTN
MPTSILWVGLIIAWLVVLVPMLVARHPKVNSVTDATLETRVLHRGGSARLRLRRKVRPTPAVSARDAGLADDRSDGDADPLGDGGVDRGFDDGELGAAFDKDMGIEHPVDVSGADGEIDDAHAYVDFDVDEPSRRLDLDSPTIEIAPEAPAATEAVRAAAPQDEDAYIDDDTVGLDEPGAGIAPEVDEEFDAGLDDAGFDDTGLDGAGAVTTEVPEPDLDEDAEQGAASDRPGSVESESVRRRGGFDPDNDARITQARYRSRQRVTFVLAVLAVVALGAALLDVQFAWYGFGATVGLLVVYLAYLRRTVRIESEIRRRRLARLERAQREREREVEVVDGVPAYRRRYGAIIMEIDDEDPAFDHLPRYRAEEFDFLRRADDAAADLRQPLRRAAG